MKLLIIWLLVLFASCIKQQDEDYINNDAIPGTYIVTQVPAELHYLQWPYRTVWILHRDTFEIHLYDSVWHTNEALQVFGKDSLIHFETGVALNGNPAELFKPNDGLNPFFPYESLSGCIFFATNNYVSYGSYLNRNFTLNKVKTLSVRHD